MRPRVMVWSVQVIAKGIYEVSSGTDGVDIVEAGIDRFVNGGRAFAPVLDGRSRSLSGVIGEEGWC